MRVPFVLLGFLQACAALPGCRTPVGLEPVGRREAYDEMSSNALETSQPSDFSRQILERHALLDLFAEDPEAALRALHKIVSVEGNREYLVALAELSFLAAENLERKKHYLASVMYAYDYLYDSTFSGILDPYDPQFRLACDLYNAALTEFLRNDDREVELREGVYGIPFGLVEVRVAEGSFPWPIESFTRFLPASDFKLRGLRTRNRRPGLGVALIAERRSSEDGAASSGHLAMQAKVAATAILRVTEARRDGERWEVVGSLELHDPRRETEVQLAGKPVPLEMDLSAPIAYAFQEPWIWDFEFSGLFSSDIEGYEPGIYLMAPYSPGKIPVVFVHGTASSPARWAEMLNGLEGFSILRQKYQFWVFIYTTGNPIAYSAMLLRNSIEEVVRSLDPEGKDPALRNMVVVGHSQGGLLTRMLLFDSGSRLMDDLLARGIDPSRLSPEDRRLLEGALVFKRSPFVKRAVFIATPHRGSFVAAKWYSKIGAALVSLPDGLVHLGKDVFQSNPGLEDELGGSIPTSIDNMDPSHPFIRMLDSAPISPEVKVHSIIPVEGGGPVEDGDDGVVEYRSAHLDGVESEFVLRCGHSCQSHPLAIMEVRRILLEHLRASADHEPRARPPEAASTGTRASWRRSGFGSRRTAGSRRPESATPSTRA